MAEGHAWQGGHVWQGPCMTGVCGWWGPWMAGDGCMAGGVCGRGHAWQGMRGGGHAKQGACEAGGHAWQGACMAGGHAWQGGMHDRGACMADTTRYRQ